MKPKPPKPHWLRANAPALLAFGGIIGGWLLFGDVLAVFALALFSALFYLIGWSAHSVAVKPRAKVSLRTALILLLATSGILWLNTRPSATNSALHTRSASDGKPFSAQATHYGWPIHAVTHYKPLNAAPSEGFSDPNIPAVMLNTVVALCVLVPLGYLCETKFKSAATSDTAPSIPSS
jgi:hypothetical protein